jgi:uncharacterized OsmC-like protein
MSTQTATQKNPPIAGVNGVEVDQLLHVIDCIGTDEKFGAFQFRADNQWIDGGLNRSSIKGFYAGGREDTGRTKAFELDADEPPLIAGNDTAPNPVEYVLHALAGCLTTTMVYHAAVRDIRIESCESHLEGDIDVRGLLGLAEDVPKGFNQVRVVMKVKSDADVATLTELAMFSAVYEMISNALPVDLVIQKV